MTTPSNPTAIDWQNTPDFWQARYEACETPWNQERPSPRLQRFLDDFRASTLPATGRVLVLGCGHGHEAALFSEVGYDVTAIDIAPKAIEAAQARYGHLSRCQFEVADALNLPEALHGQFDMVVEYTFFCAIHPDERAAYAQSVLKALKPNGVFLGAMWLRHKDDAPCVHPPFRLTREEIGNVLFGYFNDVKSYDDPELDAWSKLSIEAALNEQKRAEWIIVLKEPKLNAHLTGDML